MAVLGLCRLARPKLLVLGSISSRSFVGRQSLDRSLAVAAQKALGTNHFRAGWTATITDYGDFADPEAYLAECLKRGHRCAPCPEVSISEIEKIRTIQETFARADVLVAEFDAWVNPLDLRPEKRQQNRKTIAETLAVADEVGAVCCATVVGAFSTDDEVGQVSPHPDNFAKGTFDAVVEWVRKMLAEVNPRRTKLTLEMSPWTFLNGPDCLSEVRQGRRRPEVGCSP